MFNPINNLRLVFLFFIAACSHADNFSRVFSFQYKTVIEMSEEDRGAVHIFVPLAMKNKQQTIIAETVQASISGVIETEDKYGNRYWHGSLDQANGEPIEVTVSTTVERKASRLQAPEVSRPLSDQESEAMALYLGANSRVVVDHPILDPILAEVKQQAASQNPVALSRAIYDWVVDNVEYKKVGTGWGNGDTFWACNERYGNCTDFHALFISLARSENIPARFEIGFPVPSDRDSGNIGGYHCWVQFYLPNVGWFPIDASEAFKAPEKKEFFFGAYPEDRIHFSTGRDLRLGKAHKDAPLNYFVYPYVEVDGKAFKGKMNNTFSFQSGDTIKSEVAVSL